MGVTDCIHFDFVSDDIEIVTLKRICVARVKVAVRS